MLLCSLLVLSLIFHLSFARPAEPSTSATNGPLLLPSGTPDSGLDVVNLGSMIGGASAAAVGVTVIALALAILRRSRRRNCLYHNKELGEVLPSLTYRKRGASVEAVSVDSSESDLRLPAPALLPVAFPKVDTVMVMREKYPEEPPAYFLQTSIPARPSPPYHPSP